MTATVAEPTLRWSSVRDCPRKAVFEAVKAPARERTDREERILFRGRRIGRDYADWLAAKYGDEKLERERKVVWPLGIGHIDVYLLETRTAIEVLSSAHASEQMIRSKLLQLVGYMKHDDDVDNGVLVILDPSNFAEERVILSTRSQLFAELEAEADERIAEVLAWRDGGDLPQRVCGKPSESHGHFCLHAEHCFTDWAPPPLEEIAADPALIDALTAFDSAKKERAGIAIADKALERKQKDAQQVIEEAELPAGVALHVGPFKVTRTAVQRKSTFEWERAESAGVFDPEAFGEFFRPGASYSTYRVDAVGEPVAEDFGDVPF